MSDNHNRTDNHSRQLSAWANLGDSLNIQAQEVSEQTDANQLYGGEQLARDLRAHHGRCYRRMQSFRTHLGMIVNQCLTAPILPVLEPAQINTILETYPLIDLIKPSGQEFQDLLTYWQAVGIRLTEAGTLTQLNNIQVFFPSFPEFVREKDAELATSNATRKHFVRMELNPEE